MTLSLKNTIVDTCSCALHKMLLVVLFCYRALLLLSQLSYSTSTGLSRASFSCFSPGDMECAPWLALSLLFTSCFQSRLCSLHDLYINMSIRYRLGMGRSWQLPYSATLSLRLQRTSLKEVPLGSEC